jgi:hypothetical protein
MRLTRKLKYLMYTGTAVNKSQKILGFSNMLRTCGRIRNQELDRHQKEKSDPFCHQNNAPFFFFFDRV